MASKTAEQLQAAFPPIQRAALDRIVRRAGVDLPYTLVTIGTGSPSTVKRATAIQMALDGKEIPAIAATVDLSESRIQQVMENVLQSGIAALYPQFSEMPAMPEGMSEIVLWNLIWPVIQSVPSKNGTRGSVWNPAMVLDYLVYSKTLQDSSVGQIANIIRRNMPDDKKPLSFEDRDMRQEPDKRLEAFTIPLSCLLGAGLLALGVVKKEIPVILFSLVWLLVAATTLIKQVLEWRLLRKVVAKKDKTAASTVAMKSPPFPLNSLALPKITFLHALSLPPTPWHTDTITDTANALGQPPLRVLYLWVFAAQTDQGGFETEGWPQLGSVHLLLNSSALSVRQLAGSISKFLVDDQAKLEATIRGYNDKADTYERPLLFVDGALGKRPYNGYPIHTLVCNDGVWKPAVNQLAARCDIAVVNLSGYNPNHPGLEYEIHHLLSGGPPRKFFFIYERTTDADAVVTSVLDIWSHLEATPAVTPELIFMRVPDSQDVGYTMQFRKASLGTGWLANVHLDREGEYIPIAPRILTYINSVPADRTAS